MEGTKNKNSWDSSLSRQGKISCIVTFQYFLLQHCPDSPITLAMYRNNPSQGQVITLQSTNGTPMLEGKPDQNIPTTKQG